MTDLKPLGKHPNGLLIFFIILTDWWIASGGEQLTKKELMFVFLNSLSASSKLSPDLSNVPSSSCTQKLNQTFFSVFKATSETTSASSIELTVSQQKISTCGCCISTILL